MLLPQAFRPLPHCGAQQMMKKRRQVGAMRAARVLAALFLLAASAPVADRLGAGETKEKQTLAKAAAKWKPLFDGKTLRGWKITQFGGQGDVTVQAGTIELDFGSPMTGITYTGKLPKCNYEIQLDAKRIDGVDFFCALTFPVNNSYCSLIVGGWGGAVVGISSIDGHDASENETTRYMSFKKGRWYHIRVRVQADRIQAWIDRQQVVNLSIRGRKLTTRAEVDLSKPLGIASFETRAGLRNIRIRELNQSRNQ